MLVDKWTMNIDISMGNCIPNLFVLWKETRNKDLIFEMFTSNRTWDSENMPFQKLYVASGPKAIHLYNYVYVYPGHPIYMFSKWIFFSNYYFAQEFNQG